EAVDIVFQSFNRYLGVAVGEHLGYALTGAWTTLAASPSRRPPDHRRPGLGRRSRHRHRTGAHALLAGVCRQPRARRLETRRAAGPITYIAWSLSLIG